jgi:1,2-phenylacetyl-CoA epoxidase PaaB subunit
LAPTLSTISSSRDVDRYTVVVSKIREQFQTPPPAPLAVSPTGDLKPYVIFTQLKSNGPYIYAGWLEAADDDMAMAFAKEHYGQDQECVNIWAIDRVHVTSSDGLYKAREAASGGGKFEVFTQKRAGDLWLSAGEVSGANPQEAIEAARSAIKQAANAHTVWVVAKHGIISTHGDPPELIWRHTDQSYRLARGYGREVRAKWIAFRDEKQLAEYEKDDLADAF